MYIKYIRLGVNGEPLSPLLGDFIWKFGGRYEVVAVDFREIGSTGCANATSKSSKDVT